jgi:hypothetical protein
MDEHVRAALLAAYRHVFRPLVRLALRNGISYEQFAETLKRVFIESAREDFDIPEARNSRSKVAILTGLSRKDVKYVDDAVTTGFGNELERLGLIGRLVEGWTSDGDFTGPYGIPLEIDADQPGPGGFPLLAKRYGENVSAEALRAEMHRIGVVEETRKGKLRLLSRSYISGRFRPEAIDRMGRTLGDFAETLVHNLAVEDRGRARFERRVYTPDGVDAHTLKEFRDVVRELGQEFLENLDNWFTEKEQDEERRIESRLLDPQDRDANRIAKVGVGVFLYEHHNDNFSEPEDGEFQRDGEGKNEAKEGTKQH